MAQQTNQSRQDEPNRSSHDHGVASRGKNRAAARGRGFTLIELLVVIAVIAIIAAILFPAFASAREKARQITCVSNLKQMSTAFAMYEQDNDESYPYWDYALSSNAGSRDPNHLQTLWFNAIYPYVKNAAVFTCPDSADGRSLTDTEVTSWLDPGTSLDAAGILSVFQNTHIDYGYNEMLSKGLICNVQAPCTDAAVSNPSQTLLVADSSQPLTGWSPGPPQATNPSDPVHQYIITRVAFANVPYEDAQVIGSLSSFGSQLGYYEGHVRHVSGSNVSFADGHTKYVQSANLTYDLLAGEGQ
jgi:prepilin-type N-terminal cleavage/methylation domain-containing protein/prepilin-type processing-associated H-X9-DG protein